MCSNVFISARVIFEIINKPVSFYSISYFKNTSLKSLLFIQKLGSLKRDDLTPASLCDCCADCRHKRRVNCPIEKHIESDDKGPVDAVFIHSHHSAWEEEEEEEKGKGSTIQPPLGLLLN